MEVEEAPLFVAAVFKNEAPYLKEWLDFHLAQGVQRFYLADNFSDDHYAEVLAPYLKSGQVHLHKTRSRGMNTRLQAQELNRLLKVIALAEGKHAWVAIIDIDEFLFNPAGKKVRALLSQFKGQTIAAIFVNWLMFGTSNLAQLDTEKPMLSQLTWRAHASLGEHKMGKPILYLANSFGFLEGPHLPFRRGSPQDPQIQHEVLRLNHYWYRSEEYYNSEKRKKRWAFGDSRSGNREQDHIKACNYEQDFSIQQLLKS